MELSIIIGSSTLKLPNYPITSYAKPTSSSLFGIGGARRKSQTLLEMNIDNSNHQLNRY